MEHFTPSEAPIHETQRLPIAPPKKVIGRDRELGQTFAQVRAGAAVLLYGPDGVGKSTLAATIAAAFTAFPGGVLWWPVDNELLEHLIVRLGRAYGERMLSDSPEPLEHLDAALQILSRDNKPLIVLDGRLDLDVARDFVRRVALGVPIILANIEGGAGPWTPFSVEPLSDDDAVDLFIQAAGYDQISSLIRADIHGVCNALGGLPLAIMLAGRHVRATDQTPGEFLGSLTSGGDGLQVILHNVFHQLPDALRGMLLTLGATFAGQASAELLAHLHAAPSETVTRVMDMLAVRGLVHRLPCPKITHCYRLHEAVHRFAQAWLRDTGRLENMRARALEAVTAYADQYGTADHEAQARLIAEMPNIMAAARYAARRDDSEPVRKLAAVLQAAFGEAGGYGYELHLLSRMAEVSPAASLEEEAGQMALFAGESAEVPEEEQPPAEQEMLQHPPAPTAEPAPSSIEAAVPESPAESPEEEVEKPPFPSLEGGEIGELQERIEAARAAGRLTEAGALLNIMGQALLEQDRLDEAAEAFEESLAIFEDAEDAEGMLVALEGLAGISLDRDDLDNAVVYANRAVNLAEQRQDMARHGHLLALLGDIRLELGDLDQAVETYVSAMEIIRAVGDELSLGVVQTKLGNTYIDRGDLTQAVTMLTEALAIFEREERQDYQGRVLGDLGLAYSRMGQWEEAERYHQQALEVARQFGDVDEMEHQLASLAYIAQARGDREGMITWYRQALDLAYRAGETDWQARYLTVLGRLLMDDVSQVATAVRLLDEANTLAPDDERERWLRRARKRLEHLEESGIAQAPQPESIPRWAAEGSPFLEAEE